MQKMTRHFFISSDMDDLERLEEDLERAGIVTPQIHVLTLDDSNAANHHHLHAMSSLMKRDVVHSGLIGAGIGLAAALVVLLVGYLLGVTQTAAGWIPLVFLAIIALGFFTWQGGLFGMETPNVHFKRFEEALEAGRHVFFVDLKPEQRATLNDVVTKHTTVEPAGTGAASPPWLVLMQHRVKRFFVETFP